MENLTAEQSFSDAGPARRVRAGETFAMTTMTLNGKTFEVDDEIASIVHALNAAGISTVASCSGHGMRPGRISLADGRELFVLPSYEIGQWFETQFPRDINGQTKEERAAVEPSSCPHCERWKEALVVTEAHRKRLELRCDELEEGRCAEPPSDAARDVLAERERQKSVEGWTPEHDDEHNDEQLALAAACYALGSPTFWPWENRWWKPKDRRRNLVRAGALILAEIERIDRQASTKDAGECGACDKPGEHCANVHGICSRHGGRAHETSAGDSK